MILKLISKIFSLIVDAREALYQKNLLKSYSVGVPVISIGNLTFGGTGKTPICDFLIQNLKKKKKIAVISRGYGRQTKGFFKIDLQNKNATRLYGDEPTWLATQHPDVNFYVCENRVLGCQKILEEKKVDLILADDAFQHRRLQRSLDIVVLDATEDIKNYEYPPLGRARNSFEYLKKADCVFVTKTNLSKKENLIKLTEKIPKTIPIYRFTSTIDGFFNIYNGEKLKVEDQKVYLLSGIGHPQNFENLIQNSFHFQIAKHFIFPDHAAYNEKMIEEVIQKTQGAPLLITQKDSVKIREMKANIYPIYESRLKFESIDPLDTLYDKIY